MSILYAPLSSHQSPKHDNKYVLSFAFVFDQVMGGGGDQVMGGGD